MFADLQDRFAEALLDAERRVPAGLTSQARRVPERRFAVYRNNVVVGLVNALARRFPATERIVGEEFFRAMARLFVTAQPPRSPLLMTYGDGFPDFIADFPPAAEVPYLADVARLEAARTRAYHAPDAAPVDAATWSTIDERALGRLRIERHPSAEIVRSPHPVVTIWAMNAGERELGPIHVWEGEDALVLRPALEVQVRALPAGGAAFLAALFAGDTLAEALDAGQRDAADFDPVANLAGLVASGAACGYSIGA